MPFADAVAGYVHVGDGGMAQRALAMLAARSHDAQAVGNAVPDVQVMDVHAGNAATVKAKLERSAPRPVVIVAAAADEVAVLHDVVSSEFFVIIFLFI